MNLDDCKALVRKTARSLPPSDFGSTRAIDLMATVMLELVDDVLAEASASKVYGALPFGAVGREPGSITDEERKLAVDRALGAPPSVEGGCRSLFIPPMAEALLAYVRAQSRMLENWADGDDALKADLWRELHACEKAGRDALFSNHGGRS